MKPSARDEWDVFKRAVESAKSWDDVWSVANHGPKSGKPGGSYYTNLAYLMNCRVPPDGADARQLAIYEDLARRLGRRPLTASEAAEVLRAEVRKQLAQGIAHGQLGAMILPETGVYVGLREAIAAEVRKIDASAEGRAASLQLTTGAPGDKMTVAARTLDGVWSVWHVEAPLAEEK